MIMKIEIPFLAGLLVIGNDFLARAAVQGFEPALVTTVVEYGASAIKSGRKFLANAETLRLVG
jgi:hypothetical protein